MRSESTVTLHPIYAIKKSYAENLQNGPSFNAPIPNRILADEKDWIDFLGYRIASPLGVPAGPLLDSTWTTLAANLGFDVVTYKTIRSQAYAGYPLPNVIYVKQDQAGTVQSSLEFEPSITNSFGMPSMSPEYLQKDIAKAKSALKKGQLLIVSVVGSPNFSKDLTEDFVRTAQMAKDAGAQVIEANFSCPNVSGKEGCLYFDQETSFQTASAIVKAIYPIPLLIKVGKYKDKQLLKEVFISLDRAKVKGVCGINSVSMRVVDSNGTLPLGKGRETSGICGDMIRPSALDFLKDASDVIKKEHLNLELAGCGGITHPDHFDDFLQAGAKVAMTATGMMWNPYLANQWHLKQASK